MQIWLDIADRLEMCGDLGADKVADFLSCAGIHVGLVDTPLYEIVSTSNDTRIPWVYPFRDLDGLNRVHARTPTASAWIHPVLVHARKGNPLGGYLHVDERLNRTTRVTEAVGTWYTERNGGFKATLFIAGTGSSAWYDRAEKLRKQVKGGKDIRTRSAKEAARAARWRPVKSGKAVAND